MSPPAQRLLTRSGVQRQPPDADLAMSEKLLATIGDVVTLDLVDAMAERVQIDRASARKAAELGVPAILVALTDRVGRANGVARLTQALQKGSVARGPEGAPAGVTAFVLGDERAGALASAIGRFVGARESSTLTFLDQLTVAILGALGQASGEVNGKTIATLLKAQSEDIAAAMPVGLASLLAAHGSKQRPGGWALPTPARGRDGSAVARRTSRAAWALALLAITGLAWYLLAVGMQEQTGGEPGEARPLGQVGLRAEVVSAIAHLQSPDFLNSAGERMRARITAALVSLGRRIGLPEGDPAISAAQVALWSDQGRAEEPRVVDGAKAAQTGPSAPALGRQRLSFVAEGFREAICNSRPITTEQPVTH
jgi:hypothetical protein